MRLVDFTENVAGFTGRDFHHSLYNRQPGNPHCTLLLSSVPISHPLWFPPLLAPTLHLPSLPPPSHTPLCSFSLLSLSSVFSSPHLLSKVRNKLLSSSHAKSLGRGGGTFLYPYCFTKLLFQRKTLPSYGGIAVPDVKVIQNFFHLNTLINKKYAELSWYIDQPNIMIFLFKMDW